MRVAPYRTMENKILGCVITLVDVTTQKQEQAKLQNTEQRLTMAQQASEAKSDFLTKIAHEIRSPMSELTGLTELAKAEIHNPEELAISLNKMSDTLKYMNAIVADISEMTKMDQFEVETAIEPFSLRDAVDKVVEIVQPGMTAAGLQFKVIYADDFAVNYLGSKSRLQQILINFLSNAMKYTPSGGRVSLQISETAVVGNKSSVCFVIADTGIGISEAFIPEMFKPFTRESRTDSNETTSMGLGLSIAHNLINLMNGDVHVKSEVGKGTTFTVHVLLEQQVKADGTPIKANSIKDLPDYQLTGHKALVVDDNEMNRKILGSLLAHEGMTFEEAEGGAEALQMFLDAPEKTYDCILMDIRMPEVDGIQATMMIRSSDKIDATTIPIIGVSANGFPEDMENARKAGMNSYQIKPIDNQKLFKTMSELIYKEENGFL